MLLGTHTPRLDDKGRLFLPAKFRDELKAGVVLTKGQDRCVVVWPVAGFEAFAQKLETEALRGNDDIRAYLRVLFSSASDQVPDAQGRISVPAPLREFAHLAREVTVVGNGRTCEIWETAAWESYVAEKEDESYVRPALEVVRNLF